MPGIFDDEVRDPEPIWPNPSGTWPLWPLARHERRGCVDHFKRFGTTSSGQSGRADTLTLILNRP